MRKLDNLADDLLDGGAAISRYTGFPTRRVYSLIEQKVIPARKLGHRSIIAFKSEIDAALRDREQADAK
jgi:predicted DNA-binding transcriptional regulator AlpA